MNTQFPSIVAAALLIAGASPAPAMISLAPLSKERAATMGITMKSRPNGDAGVKVWLEFKKEGVLEAFSYAELRVLDSEGEHRLSTMLRPHPVVHGQPEEIVTVAFSAAPDELAFCQFWVVAYGSLRGDIGYMLDVKDFLDLGEISGE